MSRRKPNFSTDVKRAIAEFLLENSEDGSTKHGTVTEAAIKFGCSRKTVSAIWVKAKTQVAAGVAISLISKKKTRIQSSRIHFDQARLVSIDKQKRSTFRSIAREMKVSKSTVGRWYKEGVIKAHTNPLKPSLTEKNKYTRLKFCLEALKVDFSKSIIKFKSMQQTIHIDEKWFNLTKTNQRYYLAPGEEDPYRHCQSKRFITKVMFLCAVARPLFSENGDCLFDGKIGIFPFTKQVPAKRNSKNRPAGTMETKAMNSVTKEVTKQCLINQVIPAIKAKWPASASKEIRIQQDNARPHLNDSDPNFRVAATADGFDIHLVFQPPNSPDTNINDLGWFRALQSLQHETAAYSVDELLGAVETSFETLEPKTLNCVFLTLQGCMKEILVAKGHNNYKIPHMKKESLMRTGNLPIDLEVDKNLVKACIEYLEQANEADGFEELKHSIDQLPNLEESSS